MIKSWHPVMIFNSHGYLVYYYLEGTPYLEFVYEDLP